MFKHAIKSENGYMVEATRDDGSVVHIPVAETNPDYLLIKHGSTEDGTEPIDIQPYEAPPADLSVAPKQEAGRRIIAVFKDDRTQGNLTEMGAVLVGKALAGTITEDEQVIMFILAAAHEWKVATLGVGRALAAAGDETFADDQHWPPVPDGLAALVEVA